MGVDRVPVWGGWGTGGLGGSGPRRPSFTVGVCAL